MILAETGSDHAGRDHSGARQAVNGSYPRRYRCRCAIGKIRRIAPFSRRPEMNEEALNTSLRKFLKTVGVTSQREIEKAVRAAVADGRLKGNEALSARMVLTVEKAGLSHKIDGTIELE
jgi:hypothetical protein